MKPDGGPAFPRVAANGDHFSGMSLRDYFAAKAMAAYSGLFDVEHIAREAYKIADAMLDERNK